MERRIYTEQAGIGLPPPLDRHPEFPLVAFDFAGNPYLGGTEGIFVPLVCQIVVPESHPYVKYFGEGSNREWDSAENVYSTVRDWYDLGLDVVVHPRRPGVKVAGFSYGRSRFLCGAGFSVFVVRELGPLPDGVEFGSGPLTDMVAVVGVTTPRWGGDYPISYQIFPREYIVDPALPGLPRGLTGEALERQLPPPPVFSPCTPVGGKVPCYYARIWFELSEQEYLDGGGAIGFTYVRGRSYFSNQG